jgi:hypothetical protein
MKEVDEMKDVRAMIVNGAMEELKTMIQELKEELYRASTIEQTLSIAEEIQEAQDALQDAKIHYNHYLETGYIYQ